jgi:Skp family chaperone for outer membrane proteins
MQRIIISSSILLTILAASSFSQQTKPVLGIYDSRAIAIVYARSSYFESKMKSLQEDLKKAKNEGDSTTIKKLNKKGELEQRILHDQGFGSGSVIELLSNVKDSLNSLIQKKHLSGIVSKWELMNLSTSIDTLDVTLQVIEYFNPNDMARNTAKQIMKSRPIRDAFFIED